MPRQAPPEIEEFPGSQADGCRCAWRGCDKLGAFPAPKDRRLSERYMFCLDHVRAYNAQWDFHRGLSPNELEVELRGTSTWDRPTWKLGSQGSAGRRKQTWNGKFRVEDPFDLGAGTDFDPKRPRNAGAQPAATSEEARALKLMGLSMPLTLEALKLRYKALVKKYHPDANGGSAEAETRMKRINAAYQTLRATLASV